jgi:hypothetical protein
VCSIPLVGYLCVFHSSDALNVRTAPTLWINNWKLLYNVKKEKLCHIVYTQLTMIIAWLHLLYLHLAWLLLIFLLWLQLHLIDDPWRIIARRTCGTGCALCQKLVFRSKPNSYSAFRPLLFLDVVPLMQTMYKYGQHDVTCVCPLFFFRTSCLWCKQCTNMNSTM